MSQNADGHLLGHVRDEGLSSTDTDVRIYQTSERQSLHTDSTDIVGLLCLKDALEGGESLLVSAVTIFNEIAATRRDLLPPLFDTIVPTNNLIRPLGLDRLMDCATIRRQCLIS